MSGWMEQRSAIHTNWHIGGRSRYLSRPYRELGNTSIVQGCWEGRRRRREGMREVDGVCLNLNQGSFHGRRLRYSLHPPPPTFRLHSALRLGLHRGPCTRYV